MIMSVAVAALLELSIELVVDPLKRDRRVPFDDGPIGVGPQLACFNPSSTDAPVS